MSQLSDLQTSLLTEMYLKSRRNETCEPEKGLPPQKKKFCMWGPERPTYTMDHPAKFAVFNSITDNAAVGDERNFVRIVEKGIGGTYCSNLVIEPEKEYDVFIYLHNDASSTYNDEAHNYVGVAINTRLSCAFPTSLSKGEEGLIHSTITSSSANPPVVWAGAYVTASEDMTLHYVAGSAKIYNAWAKTGRVLSMSLFSEKGTFLGMRELNGVYPGCDEFSGSVRYTIQTHMKNKA